MIYSLIYNKNFCLVTRHKSAFEKHFPYKEQLLGPTSVVQIAAAIASIVDFPTPN